MSAGEGENVTFSDDGLGAKEAVGKALPYGLLAGLGFSSQLRHVPPF